MSTHERSTTEVQETEIDHRWVARVDEEGEEVGGCEFYTHSDASKDERIWTDTNIDLDEWR